MKKGDWLKALSNGVKTHLIHSKFSRVGEKIITGEGEGDDRDAQYIPLSSLHIFIDIMFSK